MALLSMTLIFGTSAKLIECLSSTSHNHCAHYTPSQPWGPNEFFQIALLTALLSINSAIATAEANNDTSAEPVFL